MTARSATQPLEGRVALVTGSTAGLGEAIAGALGQAGARVALNCHRDAERGQRALARFRAAGSEGALFLADVTEEESVAGLVSEITASLGPIDILVVNATPAQPQRALEDYRWEEVQSLLDAFVKSPFLLAQQVLTSMKQRRWGRIIQIGSEVLDQGTPEFSAYVAAKGAQSGLSRSLSRELAPWGITVNTVSPGWIPVERHAAVPAAELAAYRDTIPLDRWGTPADVASAVTFLASEEAGFITGANLHINGGRSLQ